MTRRASHRRLQSWTKLRLASWGDRRCRNGLHVRDEVPAELPAELPDELPAELSASSLT